MDAIKNFGRKVADTTKKAGEWCYDHVWDAVDLAGCFFAGYGITAFVCDVTGLTDSISKAVRHEGYVDGYDTGYREGQDAAARIIGVANNGGVDPTKK